MKNTGSTPFESIAGLGQNFFTMYVCQVVQHELLCMCVYVCVCVGGVIWKFFFDRVEYSAAKRT